MLRLILPAGLFAIMLAGTTQAGDIWVDDDGDNFTGDGSFNYPYKTLSHVLFSQFAAPGDVIKLKPGTYNEALGEAFPLEVPDGVLIQGWQADEEDWPRIGGDVNDDNPVPALFLIDATTSDVDHARLERLYFLGENTANADAPSSVMVLVSGDHDLLRSGITNCTFERSRMNASQENGRPTILMEVGDSGDDKANFFIYDCDIVPTDRGGIEVAIGAGTGTGPEAAEPRLTVQDCQLSLAGSQSAAFGIRCGGGDGVTAYPGLKVLDTVIDSTGASASYGIGTGIDIWLHSSEGTVVQFMPGNTRIIGNLVKGCTGDGVHIRANESGEGANANFYVFEDHFYRNVLHGNGGAGLHVDWDEDSGYLNVNTSGNLFFDNLYGIWIDGLNDDISGNNGSHLNETIVDNGSWGQCIDGSMQTLVVPSLTNVIMWGNNGGGAQGGGTLSWAPVSDVTVLFSDWQGLPGADCSSADAYGNIDCDPEFVDPPARVYTLDAASPCIDRGTNFPGLGLPAADLWGGDRTVDGDGDSTEVVDMGCDEYDP